MLWKRIKYQLYLFQLERYEIRRYLRLGKKLFKPPSAPLRKELVWTPKAKLLLIAALLLNFAFSALLAFFIYKFLFPSAVPSIVLFLAISYGLSYFSFTFYAISLLLVRPLDFILKKRIIDKAKQKLASSTFKNLKIIGIAGSYGKTTMKEMLNAILRERYRVVKTPENINTPLGIARLILNMEKDTEILVVEMGAFQKGDIRELCEITPPDISILTGINESHLERFGSIENTVLAKFEIVEGTKPRGLIMLNADNELIRENAARFIGERKTAWFSSLNHQLCQYRIFKKEFHSDGSGITFEIKKPDGATWNLKLPMLGEYAAGTAIACMMAAKTLELTDDQIHLGFSMMRPVPHRLQPIRAGNNVLIIDDSYNGNPDGVMEAVKTLSQFRERRKIYVTPGLVELGDKTEKIHYTLGELLSRAADIVVLIENRATRGLRNGLEKRGFPKENILLFETTQQAHAAIPKILKNGDVVLFQNDLPDNY